jgi:hypothetical protein
MKSFNALPKVAAKSLNGLLVGSAAGRPASGASYRVSRMSLAIFSAVSFSVTGPLKLASGGMDTTVEHWYSTSCSRGVRLPFSRIITQTKFFRPGETSGFLMKSICAPVLIGFSVPYVHKFSSLSRKLDSPSLAVTEKGQASVSMT